MDLSRAPTRPSGQALPDVRTIGTSRISGEIRVARTSGAAARVIAGLAPVEPARPARASSALAANRVAHAPRSRSETANRVANIVLASVALVALIPVFVIIALIVKLTSPGPILYTQTRVGIDRRSRRALALYDRRARDVGGLVFTIYKFRSMYIDSERLCGEVWATKNDPRVTPVGRFLRKSRIDELPQLWNVLKGDMNIVGPRPERPGIVVRLKEDISDYALRQRAKPGITGLAQISAAYDASIDDVRVKVRYDLEYLRRQGLVEDVRIMLKTLPVMLFKRGGW
jgi:lipopolysaccharide/colanic/teichoic acid biosynthesis glycosyltransferase